MLESLKELSDRAAAGEWHIDMFPYFCCETGAPQPPICEGICTHDEDGGLADSIATCSERQAAFIVALVNAYRAGQLHDATALAEARAEGRRQGLEWLPIETAPKDGKAIVLAHEHAAFDGWWAESIGWVDGDTDGFEELRTYEPTHWMPLPPLLALATNTPETQDEK